MAGVYRSDMERPWWTNDDGLQRFITDLVASELGRLRPGVVDLPAKPWSPSLHMTKDLGADSLELLSLASSMAEAIHLHESGIEDYLLARPSLQDWKAIAAKGLEQYSASMTFRTSGSSGAAKPCVHRLAHLKQEVQELLPLFQDSRRIFSAVPAHHIFGFLFTVLLPAGMSAASVPVIDLRSSSPARLATILQDGDLVIGHPDFWSAVARAVPAMPPGVTGVTSTAPCPENVATALQSRGLARLLQIYGSSETAGIGWRDSPHEAYRLFSYWDRCPADDAMLRRTLANEDGEAAGFAVQDVLHWHDARNFFVTGRVDGAVQVGGVNVFPSRVRALLLEHPDVADASVRMMRPEEGGRLKAFVVPRDGSLDAIVLRHRLNTWLESRLMTVERPKAFTFGMGLPKTETGKQADWDSFETDLRGLHEQQAGAPG